MRARRATVTLAAALLLAHAAAPARASETRVRTLGGVRDMLDDVVNVFDYPALVVVHRNTALAELGRVVDPEAFGSSGELTLAGRAAGGFVAPRALPRLGVLGLMLGRESSETTAPDPVPATGDGVEVLYGRTIGRADAGVRLFAAARSDEFSELTTPRHVRREAAAASVTLGLGLSPVPEARVDVAARVGVRDFRSDSTYATGTRTASLEDAAAKPWSLRGRLRWTIADGLTLRAFGGHARDDFSAASLVETGPDSAVATEAGTFVHTIRRTDVGWAATLDAARELWLLVGAAYDTERRTEQTPGGTPSPWERTRFPLLVAAGEASPWPWLGLRVGVAKAYTLEERDSTNADPYSGFTPRHVRERSFPTTLTAGLRLTMRRLTIDVLLNDRTPFVQGFYASGAPVVPITSISATYRFGGSDARPVETHP